MKKVFDEYLAIPFALLLLLFLMPTVLLGGLTVAIHLAGHLPNSGLCEKPVEVKK